MLIINIYGAYIFSNNVNIKWANHCFPVFAKLIIAIIVSLGILYASSICTIFPVYDIKYFGEIYEQ